MKWARLFSVGVLLGAAAGVAATAPRDLPPDKFWALPEVNARIDPATFDRELMAAAIFHQTNRARGLLGLSRLQRSPELNQAADSQAIIGALMPAVTHDNPLPDLAKLQDRVERTGIVLAAAYENIAAITILATPSGAREVVVTRVEGREVLVDPVTRQPVPARTYAAMAAELVDQWLLSPGHRVNIVNPAAKLIGVSATPRRNAAGMVSVYAVQVFGVPKPTRAEQEFRRKTTR